MPKNTLKTAEPLKKPRRRVAVPKTRPAAPTVAAEDVARRAHELFIEQGARHGHDLEHWLAAERELRDGSAG